jgi:transcription-repair coupling factor (superfamily II helicase)
MWYRCGLYVAGADTGGLELDLVRVDGNFTFRGGLDLDLVRVDGNFTFHGGLELDLVRVDGNFTFRGGLELDLVRVDGNFTFRGGLELDLVRVDGNFTFRGGLELDLVRVDGSFTFRGVLELVRAEAIRSLKNRQSITIRSNGSSNTSQLHAQSEIHPDLHCSRQNKHSQDCLKQFRIHSLPGSSTKRSCQQTCDNHNNSRPIINLTGQ